jgi:conjugal transfer pilus assembly protein TraL
MRPIPNHLDDPAQMLLWEADEFMLLSVCFGLGIFLNKLTLMLLAGFALLKLYRRHRDRRPRGFLRHWLYWHTSLGAQAKDPASLPIPFIRRWF